PCQSGAGASRSAPAWQRTGSGSNHQAPRGAHWLTAPEPSGDQGDHIATDQRSSAVVDGVAGAMHEEPAQPGAVEELVRRTVVEPRRGVGGAGDGVEDKVAVEPAAVADVLHPHTEGVRRGPFGEDRVQRREVLVVAGGAGDEDVVATAAGEGVRPRAADDE